MNKKKQMYIFFQRAISIVFDSLFSVVVFFAYLMLTLIVAT